MAYRLKLHESLGDGVRRIAEDQIHRATLQLAASEITGTAVHETRKCLKRMRALLRLVRPGLGERTFRRENARLRGIAQLLSHARDVDILPASLNLLERGMGAERAPAIESLRTILASHSVTALPLKAQNVKEAKEAVEKLEAKYKKLSLKGGGDRIVEKGLRNAARTARRTYAEAYVLGTDEAFHEWRKSVQLHWRHMQLVSRAWPELLEARIGAAKQLSQLLGDEHDLSVLAAFTESLPSAKLPRSERIAAMRLIGSRKDELRAAAAPLGLRLHAERPNAFAASMREIWRAAQAVDRLPAGILPPAVPDGPGTQDGNLDGLLSHEKVPAE